MLYVDYSIPVVTDISISLMERFQISSFWFWYLVVCLLFVSSFQLLELYGYLSLGHVVLCYALFIPISLKTIPMTLSKSYAKSFGGDPLWPFKFFSELYWPRSEGFRFCHRLVLVLLWSAFVATAIIVFVQFGLSLLGGG